MEKALARREEARRARGEVARWDHTTIRYAAAAWDLPRLSLGHRARAIRILADRHWHLGNKYKFSKDVDAALAETVCEVCTDGHESQCHWVCRCSKIDELLLEASDAQQEIGRTVLRMVDEDEGHRIVVGDWSAANISSARRALPDASLHDVKWTLKLIQPHLVQMAHDLWDTRCAVLTGVPVPGTRPRLKRQKFYAVPSGVHKGIYESYAEVQLRHCQSQSFPTAVEAQRYIDTYSPPVPIELVERVKQDLVIFTDGSFTKAGSKPATAGWGFVTQPGTSEEAIYEGSGPLVTPEAIAHDGTLKPTNNTAELQAIQMSLQ